MPQMAYQPKNARYYRLWAADCERAAENDATTPAERAIMLHCAARWLWLADYHGAPTPPEQDRDRDSGRGSSRRSAGIEWQVIGIINPAIRHRALKLVDELEAEPRAFDNGDAEE
jgi:hypothetical protein